jgi:hypothetical protein
MYSAGIIKTSKEIGFKNKNGRVKYIWTACLNCGKERWVLLIKKKPVSDLCKDCSGLKNLSNIPSQKRENSPRWNGGRGDDGDGYIRVALPDEFFRPMARKDGYITEHRLVMAKSLGRNLHLWEIVHHLNGNKKDNRIENLQLVTDDQHKQITILENRIKYLEKRVTTLEIESVLLKQGTSI